MRCTTTDCYDVLIIGGGVIGLSLAWELTRHDAKVCLVDRGPLGKEASWAGAGMVPPGPDRSHWEMATPLEQLEGLSEQLHAQWHGLLLDQTGQDSEYQRSGAIKLARTSAEVEVLDSEYERWGQLGIKCQTLDAAAVSDLEPTLANQAADIARAYLLPTEAQIRNPRHLRALTAACRSAGVVLLPDVAIHILETTEHRLLRAVTSNGPIAAEQFCIAAGSWSGQLASQLGIDLPVQPIRGQIVLLNGPPGLLQRTVNVGPRYLTPRRDGRVLVGSTQEDVGFLKENTTSAVADLMRFAKSLAPEVARLSIETCWSGLRPATDDGLPYLGRLPQLENGWIATGHFRAGLQLSPATAVVLRSLMLSQQPPIDVKAMGVER